MHGEYSHLGAFLKRGKCERYREALSDTRLRHRLLEQLPHFKDFDPRYRLPLPSSRLFASNIAIELRRRRSPNLVYAISENPALDGKELPLVEALAKVVGQGVGTVLSCIPGCLAFVETEDERFILERHEPFRRCEYIRFVVGVRDEDSQVEQGIFQAA